MLPAVSDSTAFPFLLDLPLQVNMRAIFIYYVLEMMYFPCRVTDRSYHLLGVYSVSDFHQGFSRQSLS